VTVGETATHRLAVTDLRVVTQATNASIVEEISFSLSAGTTLGIVGESGSGKSTVALAMLGYARRGLRIDGGSIEVDGVDVRRISRAELRRTRGSEVAYVAQDPAAALNPALRVGAQLAELYRKDRRPKAQDVPRARQAMREVGLDESLLRAYPHQLSGGQQQRVCVAMAFALDPGIIVLDEPTTGLDVTTQRVVLDKIRALCAERGVAGVFISHDLAVVSEIADQVAVMYAGRIVELGTAADVLTRPRHPYTRRLISALPDIDRGRTLVGLEGEPPPAGSRSSGCSFAPRCQFVQQRCHDEQPALSPPRSASQGVRCVRRDETLISEQGGSYSVPGHSGPLVLRVRELSAHYATHPALHKVSFDLHDDECLAIVGESGSGKTTLARCIAGLHHTWTGELELRSAALPHAVRDRSASMRQSIQYVFQSPFSSLNPRRTVGKIVEQPLLQFKDLDSATRDERIVRALREASLGEDFLGRYPGQLSGGERQRVALARAIVSEPDVLICDEVTSALDVSVQAVVIEMLKEIQRRRAMAMIFVTHNLALVPSVASRVAVLKVGEIVESGDVRQVMSDPQHAYTRRLLADAPRLESKPPLSTPTARPTVPR
jgi:peptide/nickel transport system ATP-binding protein